ncbi:hypothetical protein WA556_001360 [Blastocystis sp. ATCC 50177/Nand II]
MDESGEVTIDQLDEEISTLHNDLDMFRQAIQNYIEHHDMLDDLDKDVSQEEVDRLIAYEKGDAIRLNIAKLDGSTFSIFVYKSATVNHVKLAIRDFIIRELPPERRGRVSWKHTWRKFCLACEDGTLLLDNRNFLRDFPVHEGSTLKMVVKPFKRRVKRPRQPNPRKRFFNPNLRRWSYIPPRNFNMVYNNIYRCTTPSDLNYPFLERLRLKTVVYLSDDPVSSELKSFCDDYNISLRQVFSTRRNNSVDETLVVNALKVVFDASNLPVLIMCDEGSNRTGIVVSCFRKKQKWNLASIFEEYRRYDGPKSDFDSEQFIELFDPDLIRVPLEDNSLFGLF